MDKERYVPKLPYNPDKHCGAKKHKTGEPCQLPKGHKTNHPGKGRCKYHGGLTTGAKTVEGKKKVSKNSVTHGLYSQYLSGDDLAHYEEVVKHLPGDIIESDFYLIHAKLIRALSGDIKLRDSFQKIILVGEALVESGEITKEDLKEIKLRLGKVDLETLTRVTSGASSLISAAKTAHRDGDFIQQNKILKQCIVDILKNSEDITARKIVLNSISLLKLDAGLPVETITKLLNFNGEEN